MLAFANDQSSSYSNAGGNFNIPNAPVYPGFPSSSPAYRAAALLQQSERSKLAQQIRGPPGSLAARPNPNDTIPVIENFGFGRSARALQVSQASRVILNGLQSSDPSKPLNLPYIDHQSDDEASNGKNVLYSNYERSHNPNDPWTNVVAPAPRDLAVFNNFTNTTVYNRNTWNKSRDLRGDYPVNTSHSIPMGAQLIDRGPLAVRSPYTPYLI